jgi:DNA/RNA endonuclease YhcR with UshA esterase domain
LKHDCSLVIRPPPGYKAAMKLLAVSALLTALLGLSATVHAQESKTNSPAAPINIPASEAQKHTNAMAVVTGTVVEVNRTSRMIYLNFDKPFPNQPFAAVVFQDKTNLFPHVEQLKGKTVEVTGKIIEYRNRPEIKLESTNQLKIVEKIADPAREEKPAQPATAPK